MKKQMRECAVAQDYIESTYKGMRQKEVLVVSPTHKEGERVTREIRHQLKLRNILKDEDKAFNVLKKVQFTEAEKKDLNNYEKGAVLYFHKNIKGVKAGTHLNVAEIYGGEIIAKNRNGISFNISVSNSDRFNIYRKDQIYLTQGDKIRITGNGRTEKGKHLFNGTSYNVRGFDRNGNIRLSNGSTISQNYGHFNLGYVVTSHASQGKTADKVIIAQSSKSFKASSMEQFYVSVSRGKNAVSIYTDNKQSLLRAVKQSTHRLAAMELAGKSKFFNQLMSNYKQLKEKIGEKIDKRVSQIKSYELPRQNITRTGRTR